MKEQRGFKEIPEYSVVFLLSLKSAAFGQPNVEHRQEFHNGQPPNAFFFPFFFFRLFDLFSTVQMKQRIQTKKSHNGMEIREAFNVTLCSVRNNM